LKENPEDLFWTWWWRLTSICRNPRFDDMAGTETQPRGDFGLLFDV